jgi:photosystem II stability/assembly factor-like uncharacterized protein
VRSRAAIDAKLARKKPPVAQRAEDLKRWQEARKNGISEPFDQPQQALTFFLEQRLPAGQTTLSPQDYTAGIEHAEQMPIYSTDLQQFLPERIGATPSASPGDPTPPAPVGLGTWQPVGPGNIGGRTRALLIHPTTPTTMWAAGVAGGVWKSTNGGGTWVPKADLLVNIAVNSMILDPRNPDVLYAGTGEGFFNGDAVRGAGILKSTDGGETWAQLPSTANSDFHYVQKIVMSRGSSQRLYAATRTGIFRSVDAGATWVKVYTATEFGGCMDLAIQTDRSVAMVVAACGTFAQARVMRAIDTASTMSWKTVLSPTGMGRTSLAVAPSNQSVMYAMASNFSSTALLGVWKSTNSGKTWTAAMTAATTTSTLNKLLLSNPVFGVLSQCGFGASQALTQGWYDNIIVVDPADPNVVWAGGIDLFRSDDGGANWGQASHWWFTQGTDPEYNHADHHLVVFHPNYDGVTNKVMYSANDGGVYRTDDARAPVSYSPDPITGASPVCGNTAPGVLSWTGLNNGYQTTQFYHGVPYPDASTFFGGTQDNGTIRGTLAGGPNAWSTIRGGDGGYVAVNPSNTNMLWAENTGLSIVRSTNGGSTYSSFTSGIGEGAGNFLFITPFAQDPSNASNMWIAGAFPWRTVQATAVPTVGSIWAQAGGVFGQRIGAIAVAPSNANRVYMGGGTGAGANNGRVFTTGVALSSTAATVWSFSRPRPDPTFVSWLAVHPTNPAEVYATISTFNTTTGTGHVFKSTDAGVTWTSIDGSGATGIPDVPVHSILIDPDNTTNLWVGTDIGVFSSTDGGANWARENTGFANVITESLSIGTEGGVQYIYAFTHGRSVFRVRKPVPLTTCGANARC